MNDLSQSDYFPAKCKPTSEITVLMETTLFVRKLQKSLRNSHNVAPWKTGRVDFWIVQLSGVALIHSSAYEAGGEYYRSCPPGQIDDQVFSRCGKPLKPYVVQEYPLETSKVFISDCYFIWPLAFCEIMRGKAFGPLCSGRLPTSRGWLEKRCLYLRTIR